MDDEASIPSSLTELFLSHLVTDMRLIEKSKVLPSCMTVTAYLL